MSVCVTFQCVICFLFVVLTFVHQFILKFQFLCVLRDELLEMLPRCRDIELRQCCRHLGPGTCGDHHDVCVSGKHVDECRKLRIAYFLQSNDEKGRQILVGRQASARTMVATQQEVSRVYYSVYMPVTPIPKLTMPWNCDWVLEHDNLNCLMMFEILSNRCVSYCCESSFDM